MNALTPAELGILTGHRLATDPALYNTGELLHFSGKLDTECFERAARRVVSECETLACHYRWSDAGEAFRIPATHSWEVEREIWTERAETDAVRRPFDLARGLPFRFVILEGPARDAVVLAVHHVALDGFGYSIVWQRLADVYGSLVEGKEPAPSPFAPRAPLLVESPDAAASRDFWLEKLCALPEPRLAGREALLAAALETTTWTPSPAVWEKVRLFADAARVTVVDVLTAAYAATHAGRTGESPVILGLPVMNRFGSPAARVPCMHMNIVPLVVSLGRSADLASVCRGLAAERRGIRKHLNYRYEVMQRDLRRASPRERLFGPVLNVLPFPERLAFGTLSASRRTLSAGPVPDLALNVHLADGGGAPQLELTGNALGWNTAELLDWRSDLEATLVEWCERPDQRVADLLGNRGAEARAAALLGDPTEIAPMPLLERLEEHALERGDHPALEQRGKQVSYSELLRRVRRTASELTRRGVRSGDRVAVAHPRSFDAIVEMLAVWYVGATYVPLDEAQPEGRLRQMMALAEPKLVRRRGDVEPPHDAVITRSDPAEVAYVLFTSGSTGTAKGVAIGSDAYAHFLGAACHRYDIRSIDRVLQFAPLTFDTSLEEIGLALASGATLVLREDALPSSFAAFAAELEDQRVTVADLPTAYWHQWTEALRLGRSHVPASLRLVILGGEAALPGALAAWFAAAPQGLRLVNSYGPTEATIVATTADLSVEHARLPRLPIGTPLPGVQALVLNVAHRPATEGELVLMGPTLATRYLGGSSGLDETLTVGSESRRIYRTGDLVRRDGERLAYLGRLDDELKISGHRVHPAEVEAALRTVPGVSEAAVMAIGHPGERRRLVAVVAGSPGLDGDVLRGTLRAELPGPLIPSRIEVAASLPKTPSGKIDRAKLREQWLARPAAPVNLADSQVIARIQAVWRDVLGLDVVPPGAHFHRLGGQSLQAIELALRLSAVLQRPIEVGDVLGRPALADFIEHCLGDDPDAFANERLLVTRLGAAGRAPVHVFPGAGGSSAQFLDLAKALTRYRLDVVEARAAAAPFASVEAWAQVVADHLEAKGRPPLYQLVGHSLGGVLAFETARVLERRGAKVELWLWDTYVHLDGSTRGVVPEPYAAYVPRGSFAGDVHRGFATDVVDEVAEALSAARIADSALFTGKVSERVVRGDHFTMLKRGATELAGWLEDRAAAEERP